MELNDIKQLLVEQLGSMESRLESRLEERLSTRLEERLSTRLEERLSTRLEERLSIRLGQMMDERFEEFAFTIKESFNKVDDRFDRIEFRLDEHDRRFEKNERSFDELKHMVYSNGDSIARMQKKMDEEFAAATVQRDRLSERIGHLEHAHGFV